MAGLTRLIPAKARQNILLVEVVCHGVPSLTSFLSYLDWRFNGRDNVINFSFRNKEITNATICINTVTQRHLSPCGQNEWYRAAMMYNLFLQKSCFSCRFSIIPRQSDITLGDFWGIPEEWHDPRGDSAVLVNTEIAHQFMTEIMATSKIRIIKTDYMTASKRNRRLRGTVYNEPILRNLALYFIKNADYQNFSKFCYTPLNIINRITGAISRRIVKLMPKFST